ncbi:hypothetical protein LTR56_010691 [Elasticomyces elasticus]|nr:hypothetical protein LTR56_010691 [Elasticomyces elasticus]KAK3655376.1 hypothetical protein LTR22_010261 [Elasticomyces elasticus]KAK4922110.1 hypothetical protein LTR49_010521 [Elasticomyces elasticus]KAK5719130.1 hypothetical protein LTR15_007653 [Elasticomyces elasticus]KAK5750956.1 hypothetical protein LTS12_018946 [Elasticomyces elasticus]
MSAASKQALQLDRPQIASESEPLLALPAKTYGSPPTLLVSRPSDGSRGPSPPRSREERESMTDIEDTGFDDRQPMMPSAFYKMIGLKQPKDQSYIACLADLEEGGGLYHDIRTNHEHMHRVFLYFECCIYTALLGQILLSANFIVVGAMHGECVSRSSYGERDALWEVQLQAEELHWQVAAGKPVLFADVKKIWSRFIQVKKDASMNHPDTWTTASNAAAGAVAGAKIALVSPQHPDTVVAVEGATTPPTTTTVPTFDGTHLEAILVQESPKPVVLKPEV